jgi:SNF2 family DNA or RNA helicase
VRGNQSPEEKAEALMAFAHGQLKYLVTKPSIAGYGLNLQSCARTAFCGLSDSYEDYMQCIRRLWRFMQTRPVDAHIVLSDVEEIIFENVLRKERESEELRRELVAAVRNFEQAEIKGLIGRTDYAPTVPMSIPDWLTRNG